MPKTLRAWSMPWRRAGPRRDRDGVEQAEQRLRRAVDLGDEERGLMDVKVVQLIVSVPERRDVQAVKMEIRRLLQTIVQRHRQHVAWLEAPHGRYVRTVVQHAVEPLAADRVFPGRCREVDVKLTVPPDEDGRRGQRRASGESRHIVVRTRRSGHDQRHRERTNQASHPRRCDAHASHMSGPDPRLAVGCV
jgi:hypothetical protein